MQPVKTDAVAFFHYVNFARHSLRTPLGFSLARYTVDDYSRMRCFLELGGDSGFAIKGDELVNLYSFSKGRGDALVRQAITEGARKLDCYDGYLAEVYKRNGFVETGRNAWDWQYAPDGWDASRWGTPDVVYMELAA